MSERDRKRDPQDADTGVGRDEDPGDGYGSGLETGASALGSPANSAGRVDTFNVPGERDARESRVPVEERDEFRGRRTGGERL